MFSTSNIVGQGAASGGKFLQDAASLGCIGYVAQHFFPAAGNLVEPFAVLLAELDFEPLP